MNAEYRGVGGKGSKGLGYQQIVKPICTSAQNARNFIYRLVDFSGFVDWLVELGLLIRLFSLNFSVSHTPYSRFSCYTPQLFAYHDKTSNMINILYFVQGL